MSDTVVQFVPRHPYLGHSERILQHLLQQADATPPRWLEIGCGRQSPLVSMIARSWPAATLDQIDARAEVISEAAASNPRGSVRHMVASDLRAMAAGSQDAVVAMSVFDQNPDSETRRAATEIRRVLSEGGVVVYIHNEELNPPATSASFLYRSFQPLTLQDPPRLLLPNDRWQPTNDWEYCSGLQQEILAALDTLGPEMDLLRRYIEQLHPDPRRIRRMQSTTGGEDVTFVGDCTVGMMDQARQQVARLRQERAVPLTDHATSRLLAEKIESCLMSPDHGFQLLTAGVFEVRTVVPWSHVLGRPSPRPHIVRGVSKFGYSSDVEPAPRHEFRQELNTMPARGEEDILLVGYQYGAIAKAI